MIELIAKYLRARLVLSYVAIGCATYLKHAGIVEDAAWTTVVLAALAGFVISDTMLEKASKS